MLEIKNISKSFNGTKVLDQVSLTVNKNEIVCLMGKSGAGKTTLLRCLNQLEIMDEGSIELDGLQLLSKNKTSKQIKEQFQRKVGLVFQNWNLFPHMTILQNCIDAPLYHKLMNKEEAIYKAEQLLNNMGILDKKDTYPSKLSGGQKQRAAIARACMLNPSILCFDEPTSALDSESIVSIVELIQDLARSGMGILIVTHDEKFADTIADRIIRF